MNKKIRMVFCVLLGALLAFSACSDDGGGVDARSAYKEPLENTLHKVSVQDTSAALVSGDGGNVKAEYKIVVSSDLYAMTAANFISTHLTNATGAKFEVETYDADSAYADTKYIAVGVSELFEAANKTMPADDLGFAGYYISSYGDSVFLQAPHSYGYQLGAIAFLRAAVGYDMIDEDCVIYEKSGKTMPKMEIIERPDFDFRNYTNWMTDVKKYGMGYDTSLQYMGVGDRQNAFHNCMEYLPTSVYNTPTVTETYHPDWYSDQNNNVYTQICYTAHGNAEEYRAMLETAFEVLKKTVDANPARSMVTFTQVDAPSCCECDACNAVVEKDGAISATIIRFINDLDDMLEEYLDGSREVVLAFFAYHLSINPPTTTVEEDPTLKCNPNVCVMLASSAANWTVPIYDEENAQFHDAYLRWPQYTDKVFAWTYECNYNNYMYPYNSYSAMIDSYYFLKQNKAFYIYNEGQRKSQNVTCFGKFKEYLDAKAQFDVTVNYNDLEKKFFENYFMDAAPAMKDLYDGITQWVTYLHSEQTFGFASGVHDDIAKEEFWPRGLIQSWLRLTDKAYNDVAHYAKEDTALYEKLVKRIKLETMFMRYVQCTLYAYTFSDSDLRQMRIDFKNDCLELNIMEFQEHDGDMSVLFGRWGV